jgi:hypothetical protein
MYSVKANETLGGECITTMDVGCHVSDCLEEDTVRYQKMLYVWQKNLYG